MWRRLCPVLDLQCSVDWVWLWVCSVWLLEPSSSSKETSADDWSGLMMSLLFSLITFLHLVSINSWTLCWSDSCWTVTECSLSFSDSRCNKVLIQMWTCQCVCVWPVLDSDIISTSSRCNIWIWWSFSVETEVIDVDRMRRWSWFTDEETKSSVCWWWVSNSAGSAHFIETPSWPDVWNLLSLIESIISLMCFWSNSWIRNQVVTPTGSTPALKLRRVTFHSTS